MYILTVIHVHDISDMKSTISRANQKLMQKNCIICNIRNFVKSKKKKQTKEKNNLLLYNS